MMRDALLSDLIELHQFEIVTMHDSRLPPAQLAHRSISVESGQFMDKFKQTLSEVDLVWLIAPETDGTLIELSELCYESHDQGVLLIGCGYDAILIGTSKTLCYEALRDAGIHTPPVYTGEDLIQANGYASVPKLSVSKWVAKPEDGAGCDGIRLFGSLDDLKHWIMQDDRHFHYLAQPFQKGVAASFSMLCRNGKAWLLSCNQQLIESDGGSFVLTGIKVNGMLAYWQRFETIARKIARMLPDALGYIGVDVIVDADDKDKVYVIEINPRLTTSYTGLREALGCNPAQLILDCVLEDRFLMPNIAKNQVEIRMLG